MGPHYLDRLFSPRSIALFGASTRTNSVGTLVYENLLNAGFHGELYPINPKHKALKGKPCYPDIQSITQAIDLAVIATPAASVPEIIHACGEHGVRAAIVLSAGFGEGDGKGAVLERKMLEAAHQYQIRILGPNCLGLIRPRVGMNATFGKNAARPGKMAMVSQSGALCTAILDWAETRDVGFSAIASLGDAADVDFGDLLDFLAQDNETKSILLYIEGIRNSRSFMSGLRVAARMKPVVVIKAGRHSSGSRAALTHTGALIGDDDVFDAALQRAGVVRADSISQLFAAAQLLSASHRVSGNRLAIITNGGGPGVMATDRAADLGVKLADLSAATLATLEQNLPPHWSHGNPIDLLGDASDERYAMATEACLSDPEIDGVLVMLTPQAMTDAEACARAVIKAREKKEKLVLACWMGDGHVRSANALFAKHHIPAFSNPESSVEAFAFLANYYRNQQLLVQVPGSLGKQSRPDVEGARLIIESALAEQRSQLAPLEAKALLHAFAIPVSAGSNCRSANEALVAAENHGFPVVMKINSPQLTHKTDVGGVRLNINNAQAVRTAYHELVEEVREKAPEAGIDGVLIEPMYHSRHARELLVGVTRDPVFGPIITFGAGGTAVEIMRDRAVALPPLNRFLASTLIEHTRTARLLQAHRDLEPANLDALVQALCRVSEMVCELPQIVEMDINPLVADNQGVLALDCRIVVTHRTPSLDPYSHMAIHPYPHHLVKQMQLADGSNITVRPIRPEDAEIEQSFVRKLSPQAKYFRFMQTLNELTPEMLVRFTQLDYNRELALIAVQEKGGNEIELGVARYVMNPDGKSCEFALVVADEWQHRGIGSQLMTHLMDAAQERGFNSMDGEILGDNKKMLELVKSLGFHLQASDEDPGIMVATINL
ncbi:MAG: bifunctional acetate--CoA ligase family protein/GNAT family N-acetyltransferase [Gammaproteobacteria bacterium]|nr:bifunctional acetate--CoA ligase family protein/GNAT family N-acetyltransferase [Gammaproteobacteria bacterium]MCW8841206.1 bifunctional acetate--CoA ligase family protein/GNAT family N-acetyltransferase [Gammaproteobacteria bacterium]MCW8927236.1 bifunctional acetate--CoA ligase family protein/GNAT family N-acetyltransferase [Gammaproteobacteria bacterium]MCW8957983.1 bifunctional acetate--CoA ligase family protein/GNAT family N-acetyltransferase [Gammaproteobacteria bacterium]MCW8973170.1 